MEKLGNKEVGERRMKKSFDFPESLAMALAQRALDERRAFGRHVSQFEIVEKALRKYFELPPS